MRGRIIGLALAGFLVGTAQAQTLRGLVRDAESLKPIPGVTIQVEPGPAANRVITDSAGSFSLRLPGAGLYKVGATRIGYLPHAADTVRVAEGETVTLRIELAQRAVPLHPMIVTDRLSRLPYGFEQRRAAGFGRFMDPADIEKRHASSTSDLFRGMPGVHLTPLSRGTGFILQLRKGAGFCQPVMWVDGLPIGDSRQSLDLLIESSQIEAIELYPAVSQAPVQFRAGDCGVVLFWMKHEPTEAPRKPKHWKMALGVAAGLGLGLVLLLR